LYFQVLDAKKECKSIFYEGKLADNLTTDMTHTWSYSPHFKVPVPYFADVWSLGLSLDDACPEELKADWTEINLKAKCFLKTFQTSKINLDHNCLFDLLPESFLVDFYSLRNEITKHVFESYPKPKNYNFLNDLCEMIYAIARRELNVKFENLNLADDKTREAFGKIKDVGRSVEYTPWVSATGRLSTKPNSFPILNLNKQLRACLEPQNDLFVEMDYNAAELRVLFALLGQDQPLDDVHTWISKNIFLDKLTRDETKKKVFSWLYNPKARNKKLNGFLNRDEILNKYYIDGSVHTPYSRSIAVDEARAVNYTIQSTASDLFLTSAIKIDKMLKNKQSHVAFCVHDSLVLDMSHEDKECLDELISEFSKTKFGDFKTNISLGKNFGSMKRIR
jgi:hypothetical protein